MRGIFTLTLVFTLFVYASTYAQLDCDPLSPPDVPAAGCACAFPDCSLGLNGFSGTLSTLNTTQNFPGCPDNVLNNDDWIAFIAGSTTLNITINISNCQGVGQNGASGVQAAFYSGCSTPISSGDEGTASGPIDTQCGCTTGLINLNDNNFIIGQTYYIVIDGCGGDICDYTIVVNSGSTTVPDPGTLSGIFGPTSVCPGATVTYTTDALVGIPDFDWVVNGGTIVSENGNTITVQWNTSGDISVSGANSCYSVAPVMLPVTITQLPPLAAEGEYCDDEAGYLYPGNNQWYTAGFYSIDEVLTAGPNAGCTQTTNLTVTTNPTYFIDVSHTICDGESVEIGGVPYFLQGTYNISLTTQFTNCDSTIFLDLIVLDPQADIMDPPELGCTASQVILNAALSQGDQFTWTTTNGFICAGQGTPVITACSIGEYCLEVSSFGIDNASGQPVTCTDQTCVTVTQDTNTPVLSITGTNLSCGGTDDGTATVTVTSGGVAPFDYEWSSVPVQITPTAIDLPPGDYTVTVTAANGCTQEAMVMIDTPDPLVLDMSSTPTECNGDNTGTATVMVTGGTPMYEYLWNTVPAQVTPTAINLTQGTYTVTVTDMNNCTSENTVVVGENSAVSVSIVGMNVACNNDNTGSATATGSGGTGADYTYQWSTIPVQNTQTAIDLTAGIYTVTVFDGNSCTATNTVTISEASAIVLTTDKEDPGCNSSTDGEASVVASGGTPGYSYAWNTTPVQNTPTATNLTAGTYTVTVTDANMCTMTATVILIAPNALSLSTTQVDVRCRDELTGEATVIVIGGTPPLSYNWNSGAQNTATAVGLGAGVSTVVVTDANNCSETISVTITEPATVLDASATSTPALCGQNNGMIDLTATGGTTPYTYDWGPEGINEDPNGLGPGVYTVIVTDANDCTVSISVTVSSPDSPNATVDITEVNCNGEANGTMDITVSGGITPYVFEWNPASNNGNEDLENVVAGNYSVTITDDAGCSVIANGVIPEPDLLAATATASPASCGIDDGLINVVVSGGVDPYNFDWPGTAFDGEQNPTGLAVGTYEVTITDARGCTILASDEVINPDSPTTSISSSNVACSGESTGAIDLTVTGGTTPYRYDWGAAGIMEDLTDLPAGPYEVTVTDDNNCSSVASVTIIEPTPLVIQTSSTPVSCAGETDGTASVIITGGTGPYTILWCDGQTAPDVIGCPPGPCEVIVVDANNCSVTQTVNVDEPAALVATEATVDIDCNGDATGSISITTNGGTGTYSYNWAGGTIGNTDSPTNLTAGSYTVTVSDQNGCSEVISDITLTEPTAIDITFATSDATCNQANGAIDLTVTGGTGPYGYTWTGGLPSVEDPDAVATGTYEVTVRDANGCTVTEMITVSTPSALSISSTFIDVDCNGANTGSIDLTVMGGIPPFTYLWSDAQVVEDPIDLIAGIYDVVVTDNVGCTITTSVTITEPTAIVLSSTSTDATCNQSNGSIDLTVSGGVAPYSFDWSGAAADIEDPQNLFSGSYNVTVTDDNNCTAIWSQSVETPSGLGGTAINQDANCFGENNGSIDLTVVGGTGAGTYSYLWSDGQMTEDASDLIAGNYEVTVTDGDGCTIVVGATVNEPTLLEAAGISTDASCNAANGGIDLTVTGGILPYSFDWIDPSVTDVEDPQNLFSGSYDVMVQDGNGCTTMATVVVNEPDALALDAIADDAKCNASATGSIDLTVTGGTGAGTYTYLWSDGQEIEDPIDLSAGNYEVTVTDGNACMITVMTTVGEPLAIGTSATTVNEVCGESNGSIDLTVTGGTAPYTFDWSGPAMDIEDPQNLQAGTYNVTVTDANDCTFTNSVTVNTPNALLATVAPIDARCNNEASGSIDLEISGGTAPYSVTWDNGLGMVEDPQNVAAGNYTAVVSDADNCEIIVAATVGEPTAIVAFSTSMEATCNQSNGSIDLTVIGGTAPYTFLWDGGAMPIEDPQNLSAGNYNVTITDANGCTLISLADVSTPTALSLSSTKVDASCNGDTDGSIDLTVSGGTAPFNYSWDNGGNTEDLSNLAAGVFTVTVTDNDGCEITSSITILEPGILFAENQAIINVSCNNGNDGSVNIVVIGGTAPYAYDWSNNAFDGLAEPLNMSAGNYSVTVTDANGCTALEDVLITEPEELVASATSNPTRCFGGNQGSIDLTVVGGEAPYVYNWNNGTYINQDPQGLSAGTYSVVVTDGNGCTATTSVQVNQPTALVVNIDNVSNYGGTNVTCSDATDGSAEAFGVGGIAPYTYVWNTGMNTALAEDLGAGTYQVVATDENGCTALNEVSLVAPDPISATADISDPVCFGDNNGVITVEGIGGTTPYVYSLDGGAFSSVNQIGGLVSGIYEVVIQDVNGCEQMIEAIVEDPIELEVELGRDTTIQLGDSITLLPNTNVLTFSVLDTFFWNNPLWLDYQPTITPTETGRYVITVVTDLGCVDQDDIEVRVKKDRLVFIPNIFTPNGDGVNDELVIQAGRGVSKIKSFQMFNRWGEVLHEAFDFQPNDLDYAWDGTFRGEMMNPGVFVYFAEVEFTDGRVELYKGDVTLMR